MLALVFEAVRASIFQLILGNFMQQAFAAVRWFAVTPSDSAPLMDQSKIVTGCIRLAQNGTAGTVRVLDGVNGDRTYPIQPGEQLPGIAAKVFATGTTAVGLWCFCAE